jgi:myosin heavy subunit
VTYSIAGFLEKNNDSLNDALLEAIRRSASVFIANVVGKRGLDGPGFIASRSALSVHSMC